MSGRQDTVTYSADAQAAALEIAEFTGETIEEVEASAEEFAASHDTTAEQTLIGGAQVLDSLMEDDGDDDDDSDDDN